MKKQTESLLAILIGLTPVIIIAIIFQNNDGAYYYYLKVCGLAANSIIGIIDIAELFEYAIKATNRRRCRNSNNPRAFLIGRKMRFL